MNKKLSSDECKNSRFRVRYVTFFIVPTMLCIMLKNLDHNFIILLLKIWYKGKIQNK